MWDLSPWTYFLIAFCTVLFLAVCSYAVSRAASLAHYRTKLEYNKSVSRETGDNRNGG